MCLAQAHNAVTPVRLEPAAHALSVSSQALYHWTTALPNMTKELKLQVMPQYIHIIPSEQINMVHQLIYKLTDQISCRSQLLWIYTIFKCIYLGSAEQGKRWLKQNALYKLLNCTKIVRKTWMN